MPARGRSHLNTRLKVPFTGCSSHQSVRPLYFVFNACQIHWGLGVHAMMQAGTSYAQRMAYFYVQATSLYHLCVRPVIKPFSGANVKQGLGMEGARNTLTRRAPLGPLVVDGGSPLVHFSVCTTLYTNGAVLYSRPSVQC